MIFRMWELSFIKVNDLRNKHEMIVRGSSVRAAVSYVSSWREDWGGKESQSSRGDAARQELKAGLLAS